METSKEIWDEVCLLIQSLEADIEIMSIVGSRFDTLTDSEVLEMMKQYRKEGTTFKEIIAQRMPHVVKDTGSKPERIINERIAIEIEGWTVKFSGAERRIEYLRNSEGQEMGDFPQYHKDAEALLRAIETAEISIWIEQFYQGAYQWGGEGQPEGKSHFYPGPGRIKAALYRAICQHIDNMKANQ
jgi:hypothetical protein